MIARLIAIVIVGFSLTGYAPRWLATSGQAWIIWATALAVVFVGSRTLRHAVKSVTRRVSAISRRRPAVGAVRGEALNPAQQR